VQRRAREGQEENKSHATDRAKKRTKVNARFLTEVSGDDSLLEQAGLVVVLTCAGQLAPVSVSVETDRTPPPRDGGGL
jgi:hypothetical protein